MSQVTWRASDELVERARSVAADAGRSLNDFITHVLTAAVDPDQAGTELERTRERLRRAGILVEPGPPVRRPDPDAVAAARRRAGGGKPLSDWVSEGRG